MLIIFQQLYRTNQRYKKEEYDGKIQELLTPKPGQSIFSVSDSQFDESENHQTIVGLKFSNLVL